jgi:ABC-type sugar transport system ATPase subunit
MRLSVTALRKAYPGLSVLDSLELRVDAGEVVAVRGTSGTGKSTLLHCLGLLDRPDSGQIILDNEDLGTLDESARTRARAQRIGFVFQAFHLLSDFTLRENVLMSARTAGLDLAAARGRADALLARLGLAGRDGDVPSAAAAPGSAARRRADRQPRSVDGRRGAGRDHPSGQGTGQRRGHGDARPRGRGTRRPCAGTARRAAGAAARYGLGPARRTTQASSP